jgi:serine/threonine protein phosphatase 1
MGKNNTYVIGDIHGGLKALDQLIQKSDITPSDTLILLGDYVDGWSESAQVIDYLISLQESYHCIFIRGNHDEYCHQWLLTDKANDNWLKHGGISTMESYANIDKATKTKHIDFFQSLSQYYVDEDNRLFIHAGYTSMHGPSHEVYDSMYRWDRTLWEMALTMDDRIKKNSVLYPKRLLLFNEIYIGHTPTLNYDVTIPMNGCNVWNIDTGAGFNGCLSMIDIDSKAFIQSDPLPMLYPFEKGRNKFSYHQKINLQS